MDLHEKLREDREVLEGIVSKEIYPKNVSDHFRTKRVASIAQRYMGYAETLTQEVIALQTQIEELQEKEHDLLPVMVCSNCTNRFMDKENTQNIKKTGYCESCDGLLNFDCDRERYPNEEEDKSELRNLQDRQETRNF